MVCEVLKGWRDGSQKHEKKCKGDCDSHCNGDGRICSPQELKNAREKKNEGALQKSG